MGSRGPIPKPSGQRRRRNKPAVSVETAAGADQVDPPRSNSKWHPVAKRWFESLGQSGQAAFYEPSDWATAYLVAEAMSRELKPQPIGATDDGTPIMAALPPKGASLAAWLKAMTGLLATAADRRRVGIEMARPPDPEEPAAVSELDEYRRRLQGPQQ